METARVHGMCSQYTDHFINLKVFYYGRLAALYIMYSTGSIVCHVYLTIEIKIIIIILCSCVCSNRD